MSAPRYTIDGTDLRSLGIYVSASEGIINRPKLKPLTKTSWDNYHGEDIDLRRKYYEPREISLSCFVKAETRGAFVEALILLGELLSKPGLQRLMIDLGTDKPLVYDVYSPDEIAITKSWSDTLMVGTFKVKLIEPQPQKRVLKYIRTSDRNKTCTIDITSTKLVSVYWGDGTSDLDVSGRAKRLTHNYTANGTYYPIIVGCIDEIESITSNATTIWSKL